MSSLPDLYETKSRVRYYSHVWERHNNQATDLAQSTALRLAAVHLFHNCHLPY